MSGSARSDDDVSARGSRTGMVGHSAFLLRTSTSRPGFAEARELAQDLESKSVDSASIVFGMDLTSQQGTLEGVHDRDALCVAGDTPLTFCFLPSTSRSPCSRQDGQSAWFLCATCSYFYFRMRCAFGVSFIYLC